MKNHYTFSTPATISLLQLIFITLKLCKVINWKWSVVLIPLWVSLGITAVVLLIVAIYLIVRLKKKRR